MKPDWWALSTSEREAYHATFTFLGDRLEERETIEWALRLGPEERAKRLAIQELIGSGRRKQISSPWLETWHLVVENWSRPVVGRNSHIGVYEVRQRLVTGERTKGLVSKIVELVTPRLNIRMVGNGQGAGRKQTKKPKITDDLISCTLTSGSILDIDGLKLESIEDKDFLFTLASALDDVLVSTLDLSRRIGWDGEHKYWVIGQLHRVYYVNEKGEDGRVSDPDQFSDGVVPAVKLLYEVLARLVDVDLGSAASFVTRWKLTDSQIHLRLLAAFYRDKRMASQDDLDAFFSQLNGHQFWDLRNYPEVAELRARRFNCLSPQIQENIIKRIKKGPPRSHWPRTVDNERVREARQHNAAGEMKRILLAGGELGEKDIVWLEERLTLFPELKDMDEVEGDFPVSFKAHWVEPNPDLRFDALEGEERLRALEATLSKGRSWPDDAEGNAADWIQIPENCFHLIYDFESVGDGGAKFPRVWERFGWSHSPNNPGGGAVKRDIVSEADRILGLLNKLKLETIEKAINGISYWLSSWRQRVLGNKKGNEIWFKVWPVAVAATNIEECEGEADLNTVAQVVGDSEPKNLDTLNTPVGRLITVFLEGCPKLEEGIEPFAKGTPLRKMRDAIFSRNGRSLLIAQNRSVEFLSYFLKADQKWAEANLIKPLKAKDPRAVVLWRSISRRIHQQKALQIIGDEMVSRAQDLRLGRESRSMLVRNLVIECLHAYWAQRASAVDHPKIQQMLRSVEDEVRISGAEILHHFVRDSSNPKQNAEQPTPTPEELYSRAVKPFLQEVWPQERSLATPGVSKALADLPATTGNAFSDAVNLIERFVVPFDCWSLGDYGFYGAIGDELKLAQIDDHQKAAAFLKLLDKSVGTQENAVVPYELANALEHIRQVSPRLIETRSFRRLETVSRR